MTYWIYDPKRLTSSSTLLPYKHQDVGDVLNLFTLGIFMLYIYFYKTNQIEKFGKNLLSLLLGVLTLGFLSGSKKERVNYNIYDFKNYDNSLYID